MMEFGTDDNIVKGISVGLTYVTPFTVWLTTISDKADQYHNLISLMFMFISILLGFIWKYVDYRAKYGRQVSTDYERGRQVGVKQAALKAMAKRAVVQ